MLQAGPVAPLASHQLFVFLLQVGLLLLLVLLLGRLAARLGAPAIVGELSAGIVLGPSLLDHVAPGVSAWLLPKQPDQFHLLDAFAQIGVLLLVGITGMQLDLGLLRRQGLAAARISVFGLVVPLALGAACGYLLPASLLPATTERGVFALFLGVAMCVSAIPVIAKTLTDMRVLHRNVAQLALTAGILDDAVGWLLLSLVSAMAAAGGGGAQIVVPAVRLMAVLAVAALAGRPLMRALLRLTARSGEPGPTLAMAVVALLLSAAATQALGLEAILGAFVCGMLLASCGALELAHLAPLRTFCLAVLAPVFFATAGLRTDLAAAREPTVLFAAIVVVSVAIVGKFVGACVGASLSRLNRWEALALGAGMNARGVVELVVATVGLQLGVLSTEMYTIVVLVAMITSLMAPPVLRFALARVALTEEERVRERIYASPQRPALGSGETTLEGALV